MMRSQQDVSMWTGRSFTKRTTCWEVADGCHHMLCGRAILSTCSLVTAPDGANMPLRGSCHAINSSCLKYSKSRSPAKLALLFGIKLNFTVLCILGPVSFLYWLLHKCEATPFLTGLHVFGLDKCEVSINCLRVTQDVSNKVWSNGKLIAKEPKQQVYRCVRETTGQVSYNGYSRCRDKGFSRGSEIASPGYALSGVHKKQTLSPAIPSVMARAWRRIVPSWKDEPSRGTTTCERRQLRPLRRARRRSTGSYQSEMIIFTATVRAECFGAKTSWKLDAYIRHWSTPVTLVSVLRFTRGRGGVVVRLPASHQGEPGSIPGGLRPRIFVCGNRAGGCYRSAGFLGDLPSTPCPFIPALPPFSPQPLSSALKTSLLRAAQISSLTLENVTPTCVYFIGHDDRHATSKFGNDSGEVVPCLER
ncbi:hypothetical protein PR048_028892 [Dryococelus australis]|uniref:Uncharacterized protein n=1 Tax=Dryococelus australis TaxID=614101 RepID=A0ABQ9GC90_9NEOP|nr:hypothetical protein PR048_028892 [Dryococelus australis]